MGMKTNFFTLALLGLICSFSTACSREVAATTAVSTDESADKPADTGWWNMLHASSGKSVFPANSITYHIDTETCTSETAETLRAGFNQAKTFWTASAGSEISESPSKGANLLIICSDFPKEHDSERRPYRLRTLELNRDRSINSMIVEVAGNWEIFISEEESNSWTTYNPWAYSNVGIGHAAFGLMHGVDYYFGFWRHGYVPQLKNLSRIKFI